MRKGGRGPPAPSAGCTKLGRIPHWPLLLFPAVTRMVLLYLSSSREGLAWDSSATGGGGEELGCEGSRGATGEGRGRPWAGRSWRPTPRSVITGIEEGLLGSQQSCLLGSPFLRGPSTPPTGLAVPAAPAWPLSWFRCRRSPAGLRLGVGIHASWLCPSRRRPPPPPPLGLQDARH